MDFIAEEEYMRGALENMCADGITHLNRHVHALVWANDERMIVHTTLANSEISDLDSRFQFADVQLANLPFV